ncbi:MAG: helix-hairpin-helix domain-containing protein [Thermoproteota archaeon]
MREDYILYITGIIFFILTVVIAMYHPLWAIPTVVLGVMFIALGYYYRSQTALPQRTRKPPKTKLEPPQLPTPPTEITQEKEPELETETTLSLMELTEVKGIGQKREEQLEAVGIYTVKQLINSSPEDLAKKLDVSPKRTRRWIENAKALKEEQ